MPIPCIGAGCTNTLRRKNRSGRCPDCRQGAAEAGRVRCKGCQGVLSRPRKGGMCLRCRNLDRAESSAVSFEEKRQAREWKRLLLGWGKLGRAVAAAQLAEHLLRKFGRLVRDREARRWRVGDADWNPAMGDVQWLPKGAVYYLARVRGIAIVYARGLCQLLDPNQVSIPS